MKKLAVLSAIGMTIIMVNCTPKKTASPEASTAMTKEMAQKQYSADQLSSGQTLYTANCGTCHKLHKPESMDDVKWNRVLNRMIPKTDVSSADAALLRAYVIANASVQN